MHSLGNMQMQSEEVSPEVKVVELEARFVEGVESVDDDLGRYYIQFFGSFGYLV